MKTIVKFIFAAVIMMASNAAIQAQNQNSDNQRMSRAQLAEAQAKHIAKELALDDATTKKYVEAFCDYQKEIWALGPRLDHKKKSEMTDAETDQAIKERFERSEKILDIRQKYYKRYSQFLTPKQIERAFELERQAMKRLEKHGKRGQHSQGNKGTKRGHGKRNRH